MLDSLPSSSFIRQQLILEAVTARARAVLSDTLSKIMAPNAPELAATLQSIIALLETYETDYGFTDIWKYAPAIAKLTRVLSGRCSEPSELLAELRSKLPYFVLLVALNSTPGNASLWQTVGIDQNTKLDLNAGIELLNKIEKLVNVRSSVIRPLLNCKTYTEMVQLLAEKYAFNQKTFDALRNSVEQFLKTTKPNMTVISETADGWQLVKANDKLAYLILGYGTQWCTSIPSLSSGVLQTRGKNLFDDVDAFFKIKDKEEFLTALLKTCSEYFNDFTVLHNGVPKYQFGYPRPLAGVAASDSGMINDTSDKPVANSIFSTADVDQMYYYKLADLGISEWSDEWTELFLEATQCKLHSVMRTGSINIELSPAFSYYSDTPVVLFDMPLHPRGNLRISPGDISRTKKELRVSIPPELRRFDKLIQFTYENLYSLRCVYGSNEDVAEDAYDDLTDIPPESVVYVKSSHYLKFKEAMDAFYGKRLAPPMYKNKSTFFNSRLPDPICRLLQAIGIGVPAETEIDTPDVTIVEAKLRHFDTDAVDEFDDFNDSSVASSQELSLSEERKAHFIKYSTQLRKIIANIWAIDTLDKTPHLQQEILRQLADHLWDLRSYNRDTGYLPLDNESQTLWYDVKKCFESAESFSGALSKLIRVPNLKLVDVSVLYANRYRIVRRDN